VFQTTRHDIHSLGEIESRKKGKIAVRILLNKCGVGPRNNHSGKNPETLNKKVRGVSHTYMTSGEVSKYTQSERRTGKKESGSPSGRSCG